MSEPKQIYESGSTELPFVVGELYSRRQDVHGRFGGQPQGGMSTPARYPMIFLFTGVGGEAHGYRDEFRSDGVYWYTGEGQSGDMEFVRANRALRDHHDEGKRVLLFEALGDGQVRFVHEMEYLGHHWEDRPDTAGDRRQAIVFELGVLSEGEPELSVVREPTDLPKIRRSASLAELHRLALLSPVRNATSATRRQIVRVRSEAVRVYVQKRAKGVCEGCGCIAPFKTRKRQPYLEAHHTTRVADGGPDHPAHVIALCPTCHRRVHHGEDGETYNARLIQRLKGIERHREEG